MNESRPPVIALLDDDPDLLDNVSQMLAFLGFEPHTFATQDALLAAAESLRFEGFILDWRLESGTAARVVRALRASGVTPAAPIIVLSGNLPLGGTPTDEELASALALPQVRYRAKPCRTRELAEDLWAGIQALRAAAP